MSAAPTLSMLSIESGDPEINFSERFDTEGGFKDQIDNPIFTKEYEDAELVFSTFQRIRERGYICRGDISDVAHLAETHSPIKRLLARYPVASFTEEPSMVNWEVSNESLVRTVLTALKEAFLRLLKFLRESFARVWDNLTSGRRRTTAVDGIGPRLDAMQRYILGVDQLMNESPIAEDYRVWQRRNISSAASNLSKNWNGLKNEVATNMGAMHDMTALCVDTLVLRTVPIALMLEELLQDLKAAQTPASIAAAITKAQMVDITTPALVKACAGMGWKLGAVRTDPRITPFKSMVSFLTGIYRSQSNNRQDIKAEALSKLVTELKLERWADLVPADLADSRKRLDASLSKLQNWDDDKFANSGLEAAYTGIVIPFINMVSVNVQALSELQALASMIIATRDQTIVDISNAGLGICRGMDSFIGKERAKIPPVAMIAIGRLKQALAQS